jgi:O-antigen ligase
MRRDSAIVVTGLALVVVLSWPARADGGYTPVSLGAATVTLAAFALAVALSREVRIGRLELITGSAFSLLAAWTAISLAWTSSVPLTVVELERALFVLACFIAAVAAARASSARTLPAAVFAFALLLALDALVSGVDVPLGYANALALFCVVGVLLAVGWALERRDTVALAALPALVVFLLVIVRTDSRGAWLALTGGAAVGLALRTRRPLPATFGVLALSGVVIGTVAARESGPRSSYWGVTVDEILRHPILGSGAGTWRRVWLEHRPVDLAAQNAHSLYLEAWSELGPVGLALVLAGLLLPLVAAVRARRQPGTIVVAAAYGAFLLHLGIDWEWQLSAVPLSGVVLGVALLDMARAEEGPPGMLVRRRAVVPAAAALIALGATALAGGHFISGAAEHLRASRWEDALRDANGARSVAPWSAEAWYLRGEALRSEGKEALARASFLRGLELDHSDPVLWRALSRVSSGAELRRAQERLAQLDPQGAGR